MSSTLGNVKTSKRQNVEMSKRSPRRLCHSGCATMFQRMRMILLAFWRFGVSLALSGCAPDSPSTIATRHPERFFPHPPQASCVAALGNLQQRIGHSDAEISLLVFLFGEEPAPPMSLIKPIAVAAGDRSILVSDGPLSAIFKHDFKARKLAEWRTAETIKLPAAMCIAPDHTVLIADAASAAVLRFDPNGSAAEPGRYSIPQTGGGFRPSGVACVGGDVWVSNVAQHRIEIFDGATGRHLRAIGGRGDGKLQFCFPMGMAVTPRGDVCVVDMLNHRLQVISPAGEWLRDVGRPGDCAGCFGRPKDVAVGPDGTIFVTDAACGRVHAFDAEGRPLLSFGDPDGGIGALLMPAGIAVTTERLGGDELLPERFEPAYYVLVAEQMLQPGVRVYAWRKRESVEAERKFAVAPVFNRWFMEIGSPAGLAAWPCDSAD